MVTLVNPTLPADQSIDVPESSVWHYERSGWQVAPEGAPARSKGRKKTVETPDPDAAPVTDPDANPDEAPQVAPEGAPAE